MVSPETPTYSDRRTDGSKASGSVRRTVSTSDRSRRRPLPTRSVPGRGPRLPTDLGRGTAPGKSPLPHVNAPFTFEPSNRFIFAPRNVRSVVVVSTVPHTRLSRGHSVAVRPVTRSAGTDAEPCLRRRSARRRPEPRRRFARRPGGTGRDRTERSGDRRGPDRRDRDRRRAGGTRRGRWERSRPDRSNRAAASNARARVGRSRCVPTLQPVRNVAVFKRFNVGLQLGVPIVTATCRTAIQRVPSAVGTPARRGRGYRRLTSGGVR